MTEESQAQPIVVDQSPVPFQTAVAIRQTLLIVGAVLGALGWLKAAGVVSALLTVVGPLSVLVTFIWGQVRSRELSQKATAMANKLPDNIAVTK